KGVLLAHRRDVVETVEIRDCLQIGLVLDELLGAAVQQSDMRVGSLNDLAVHLEHEPHDAVRRPVLRAEIHREIADLRRRGELFPGAPRGRRRSEMIAQAALPADGASSPPVAFSSPGRMLSIPSHGEMKSKLRNSCLSLTGS